MNKAKEKRGGFKMKRIILLSTICLIASFIFSASYAASEDFSYAYSFENTNISLTQGPAERLPTHSVPEPSTMLLLGSALFMVGLVSKKRTIS